ncbi:MAG: zinc ribbon domain-containing protein [Lachnospiraceae bacterium]|nr:zinc ribbon domain-containing protein [Lachnospiraceae bacterium]
MEEKLDLEKAVEEEKKEVEGTVVPDKPVASAPAESSDEPEGKEEEAPEAVNINKEELKKQLNEAYNELGQKFFKEVCQQPMSGRPRELPRPSLFTDQITRIKSVKEKIDRIVATELAAKGLKACPDCENEVVLESRFCNMCGYKFPVKNDEKKMRPTPVPRCKQCGANLEPDSIFCSACGKRQ